MAKLAKDANGWVLVLDDEKRIPLPQKRFPPAWDFLDIVAELFKVRPDLNVVTV